MFSWWVVYCFFSVCLFFCPYYIVDLCLNICQKPILSSVDLNINLEILMTCFASSNIVLPSSVSVRNKPSGLGALEHVQHILDAALPFAINNHTRLQHTRTAQGFSKSRLLLEITQSGDLRCLQSLWWWLARLTHSRREGQRAECVFRQGCWSFWNLKHWDEAVRGGTALENSTNKVILNVLESFFSMIAGLSEI